MTPEDSRANDAEARELGWPEHLYAVEFISGETTQTTYARSHSRSGAGERRWTYNGPTERITVGRFSREGETHYNRMRRQGPGLRLFEDREDATEHLIEQERADLEMDQTALRMVGARIAKRQQRLAAMGRQRDERMAARLKRSTAHGIVHYDPQHGDTLHFVLDGEPRQGRVAHDRDVHEGVFAVYMGQALALVDVPKATVFGHEPGGGS